MNQADIQAELSAIRAEPDPTLKAHRLASLCSAAFRKRGFELVVVGGSAIEFYTEGPMRLAAGASDSLAPAPGSHG